MLSLQTTNLKEEKKQNGEFVVKIKLIIGYKTWTVNTDHDSIIINKKKLMREFPFLNLWENYGSFMNCWRKQSDPVWCEIEWLRLIITCSWVFRNKYFVICFLSNFFFLIWVTEIRERREKIKGITIPIRERKEK